MGFAKKLLKAALPHGIIRLHEKRYEFHPENAPLDDKKIAVISAYDITFTDLIHKAIEKAGYTSSTRISDAKYVWLHWYENGIVDYTKFVQRINSIKTWKQQGRKIIFHIHNKKPHESAIPSVAHALMTVLADSADQVSIMSEATKDVLKGIWYYEDDFSRVSTVHHPNYINSYGKKLKAPTSLKGDTLKILFFGLVRPYKGIEKLLKATEELENVEVGIFGKPKDDKYVSELKALCAGRGNVEFRLEHIPDKDIPQIFARYHVVALPYSIESSLNSGAAILALSYGRTIIGTNNGTLKELSRDDVYFGYDYKDEKDHVKQLRNAIQNVQATYDGKYNELLKVGDRAFKLVEKENGIDTVADAIKAMIQRVG